MEDNLTYEQEVVLSHVPVTKTDRISKAELNMICGYDDRKVRKILAELRKAGYNIITLGNGMWLADENTDLDDLEKYYKAQRAAAMSYLVRLKQLRRLLHSKGRKVR